MPDVRRAFPTSLHEATSAVAAAMPAPPDWSILSFDVRVEGELVKIPCRIYDDEPPGELTDALPPSAREVLSALYTRHHDGYIRQRHLARIVHLRHAWIAPFVIQLIGEYVVELLLDIQAALNELDVEGSAQRMQYGAFAAENPAFLDRTAQRVVSYWDCYYRGRYPALADYPGSALVSSLKEAAAEQHAGS